MQEGGEVSGGGLLCFRPIAVFDIHLPPAGDARVFGECLMAGPLEDLDGVGQVRRFHSRLGGGFGDGRAGQDGEYRAAGHGGCVR